MLINTSRNCRFISNYEVNRRRGFQIRFESTSEATQMLYRIGECGGILSSPRGILTSPLYPDNYPDNAECTYLISQPIGKVILIHVQSFDIDDVCGKGDR